MFLHSAVSCANRSGLFIYQIYEMIDCQISVKRHQRHFIAIYSIYFITAAVIPSHTIAVLLYYFHGVTASIQPPHTATPNIAIHAHRLKYLAANAIVSITLTLCCNLLTICPPLWNIFRNQQSNFRPVQKTPRVPARMLFDDNRHRRLFWCSPPCPCISPPPQSYFLDKRFVHLTFSINTVVLLFCAS